MHAYNKPQWVVRLRRREVGRYDYIVRINVVNYTYNVNSRYHLSLVSTASYDSACFLFSKGGGSSALLSAFV